MAQSIGKRIVQRRKALGLSQGGLAARSGVSGITISRYERGEYEVPRGRVLSQLAEALETSTDWLLHGDPSPEQREKRPSAPPVVEAVIQAEHPSEAEEDYLRSQAWDVEARCGMLGVDLVRMRLMQYRVFHRDH